MIRLFGLESWAQYLLKPNDRPIIVSQRLCTFYLIPGDYGFKSSVGALTHGGVFAIGSIWQTGRLLRPITQMGKGRPGGPLKSLQSILLIGAPLKGSSLSDKLADGFHQDLHMGYMTALVPS